MKAKIYKNIIASKFYLSYLNKLVDDTITLIIVLLIKNLLSLMILLWKKKLRRILKLLSLKWSREPGLLSIKIFLVKVMQKIGNSNIYYQFWFEN